MKRILFLFSACLLALPISAQEQDPFAPGAEFDEPELVGVHLEWIQLDHVIANKLIRKHVLRRNADDLRAEIDSLLDAGEAELAESTYLTTRDGQRAKIESIEEFIYPTEFEPPQIPETEEGEEKPEEVTPATPTAFDVRNVGTTVEIDPVISDDGKWIDINLAPEIVRYLGDRPIGDPEGDLPLLAAIRQPDFYTVRVSTATTVKDGETVLLGSFTPHPKKHADKRILLFLRGNILR